MKRIMTFIGLFLVCDFTQAAQMLPMVQTFPVGANSVLHDYFHVESSRVRVLVTNVDSSSVAISLPNGTALSEGNAANYGFNWYYYLDPKTGIKSINLTSESAPLGDYSFVLATGSVPGVLSLTEIDALQFYSFAGVPGVPVEQGKYFAVSIALGTAAGTALGAIVNAEIIDESGNTVSSVELKDGGVAPDRSIDDGLYTSIATVSQAGDYQVRFSIHWNGHQGLVYQPVTVVTTGFGLTGGFDMREVDSDSNGLIEAVELVFEQSVTREPGEYDLSVRITDSSGGQVTSVTVIADPAAPLTAVFKLDELKKLGAQPWTIAAVGLMKELRILGVISNLGTVDVDPTIFERAPMAINGVTGDHGVDIDGDGIFESLEVDIEVETQAAGYYGISSDLNSSENKKISDAGIPSVYLSQGVNSISLRFLGADIGGAGADGPYRIVNVLIYPHFNSQLSLAKLLDYVGDTSAYLCNQFAGCGSDLEAEIRRIVGLLCTVHSHRIEAKLNRIAVISRKHPDVAEQQLQVLYDRAKALERSGACPPAEGWRGDAIQPS